MAVMDTLNAKEGRGTLYFAGQGDPATMADEACHAFTMLYNAKF